VRRQHLTYMSAVAYEGVSAMRGFDRSKRRGIVGVLVVVGLVGLGISVLPAIGGSLGPDIPPASSAGVMPQEVATGGQSNDCELLGFPGSQYTSYRIDSPKSQPYNVTVGSKTVTFTLSISTGSNKDKVFDYKVENAAVYGIGVKGGTKTAGYLYPPTAPAREATWPAVARAPSDTKLYSDANLHAPRDNQNKLYSISNVTFCFDARTAAISGRVFEDANANAVADVAPAEAGLQQPVTLTRGSTSVTVTPNADGTFSFANQPVGFTYTLCAAGGTALRQTVPTTGATCGTLKGYSITLTAAGATGNLFGFVRQAPISGTLFEDANANGTQEESPAEGAVDPARYVYLYKGATQVGQPILTDSSFSFGNQDVGATYKVCVAAVPGQVQTYPAPTTSGSVACTGAAETDRGWGFTLTTAGASNLGFGSVPAIIGSCAEPIGVAPDYLLLPTHEQLYQGHDPVMAKALTIAGHKTTPEEAGKLFPHLN